MRHESPDGYSVLVMKPARRLLCSSLNMNFLIIFLFMVIFVQVQQAQAQDTGFLREFFVRFPHLRQSRYC